MAYKAAVMAVTTALALSSSLALAASSRHLSPSEDGYPSRVQHDPADAIVDSNSALTVSNSATLPVRCLCKPLHRAAHYAEPHQEVYHQPVHYRMAKPIHRESTQTRTVVVVKNYYITPALTTEARSESALSPPSPPPEISYRSAPPSEQSPPPAPPAYPTPLHAYAPTTYLPPQPAYAPPTMLYKPPPSVYGWAPPSNWAARPFYGYRDYRGYDYRYR